jgi:hypothetical protein
VLNTDGAAAVDLAGYHIYYGTSSTELTNVVSIDNVGLSAYVISNLTARHLVFRDNGLQQGKSRKQFVGHCARDNLIRTMSPWQRRAPEEALQAKLSILTE